MSQTLVRAIRAASTVEQDSVDEIKLVSVELIEQVILQNELLKEKIISIYFTLTHDLKSFNPATAIRESLDWNDIVMICAQEAYIEGGLEKCIRALIHVQIDGDKKVQHVYLGRAKSLRADWCTSNS